MAPSPPDRSLLDRLNALKPSGVDRSSPTSASHVTAAAAPDSPADVLAARLRLLRQQREPQDHPPAKRQVNPNADLSSSPLPPTAPSAVLSPGDDEDPLLFSDEQALNAFLMGVAEDVDAVDDVDDDDDDDGSFILLPDVPWKSQLGDDAGDDADDEKKVANLLESLGRPGAEKDDDDGGSGSDSDGHDMGREVQRVVDQARDEAEWAQQQQHGPETQTRRPEDAETPGRNHHHNNDDDPPLRLPSVPTKLVDPPDAADDIAERLAALRGLTGRETGLGQTDAFGLPSAPTFQPGDVRPRPPSLRAHGRVGYSDEDRRAWCVVCLEDAAVRCLGCDDDPFCSRCWREMHVGPAAGFDERGHKRVPFCRPAQP